MLRRRHRVGVGVRPPARPGAGTRSRRVWTAGADDLQSLRGIEPVACGSGPPLPSYRGYGYLERQLTSHGFIGVAEGAGGVNAGQAGEEQDRSANSNNSRVDDHLSRARS